MKKTLFLFVTVMALILIGCDNDTAKAIVNPAPVVTEVDSLSVFSSDNELILSWNNPENGGFLGYEDSSGGRR